MGEVIGRGLAGAIRAARYIPTGADVAVEQIPARLRADAAFTGCLVDAAAAASAVRHPALVSLYDVVADEEGMLVVGDVPRGNPLSRAVRSDPSAASALRILDALLGGLTALHQAGLVHGNVARGVILADDAGEVRLTGLGTAVALRAAAGEPSSPAADVRAAAGVGLDLLADAPRSLPAASRRALTRLLRRAVSRPEASGFSAAALRAAVQRDAGSHRLTRRLWPRRAGARALLVLGPVAAGVVASLAVSAARGAGELAPALVVQPGLHLTAAPPAGGCGTTFAFTGTAAVHGQGVLVYQWARSDGAVGAPRRLVISAGDSAFRVTNRWTLVAPPSTSTLRMTLRILSPAPMQASRSIDVSCD